MTRYRVDSIDDPRVAVYRDLPGRHLTRESGLFVAEGRLLVERLLASSFRTHSILIDERRLSLLPEWGEEVPVLVAPAGSLEEIIGFNFHRGLLACGHRREPTTMASLAESWGRTALTLCCVDVQDPTNLGGVLRNAAAFGVDAVAVTDRSVDPFARRVVRVSMGAVLNVPILECDDVRRHLIELRERHGFELVATVTEGGRPLESAAKADRTALIVGNEARGLPEDIVRLADRRVSIPMRLQTDSLNVAVASGVFLYHFAR